MTERPAKQNESLIDTDGLHAPEDVRKAVRQLSIAFKRSADVLLTPVPEAEAVAAAPEPDTEVPALLREAVEDAQRVPSDSVQPAQTPRSEALRRAEAILFAAGTPVSAEELANALPPGVEPAAVLMELKQIYQNRGVNLVEVDGRWRFQTASDLGFLFVETREEQRKLSQASLETLAIIAYAQPVTRAEIRDVRGVEVSQGTLDTLMEAGWIKLKGRRKTPGRPVTYGTTSAFLEHFGLESLDMLPGRAELEAQGVLSSVIPEDFEADEEIDLAEGEGEGLVTDESAAAAEFITDFHDPVADVDD